MSNRIGRGARLLLMTAAAAPLLALACIASPVEPVTEGVDAGVLLGAPCEKSLGVCAGAVHARLADGGFEPVCTRASYGSDYEPSEARCDGLDNDCDGEADRHWAVLHPRSADGTWNVPVARLDAGFAVFSHEPDGGYALHRYDDRLQPVGTAEAVRISGTPYGASLVATQQGAGLSYLVNEGIGQSSTSFAPLSADGAQRRGSDGAPLVSLVSTWGHESYGLHSTPSLDGARVLTAFHSSADTDAQYAESNAVFGVVTDNEGTVLAGPKTLMRLRLEGSGRMLYLNSVVGEGAGFLIAASEGDMGSQRWVLRLQRFSRDLEPVGEERALEVNVEPQAQLASVPGAPARPALAYQDRDDASGAFRIRIVRDLFEGGQPETWAAVPRGTPWLRLQGTARGLQLAWKAQEYCPECTSPSVPGAYRGHVFARSETSGIVELTPGSEDLLFDAFSRPGVGLTAGPEGWMSFFLPVMSDGSVALRAVSYCMP